MNNKNYIFKVVFMFVVVFSTSSVSADLNLMFLQGGGDLDANAKNNLNAKYIPGAYFVDVEVNEQSYGKEMLLIDNFEKDNLCIEDEWLLGLGVTINDNFYLNQWDKVNNCYWLEKEQSTQVSFDFAVQKISISIPQLGLLSQPKEENRWNYGTNALRVNYNANVFNNEIETSAYSSADVIANVEEWVAETSMSLSDDNFDVAILKASRPIYSLKADLTVGRTSTGNSVIGSVGMLGLGIATNRTMQPENIGYKPVFSGVAQTMSRVSLIQGSTVIYSEVVPPGPFKIDNVNLISSGDVTMEITDSAGIRRSEIYPITILSNMVSPGETEYGVQLGVRDNGDRNLGGLFVAGEFSRGFNNSTLTVSGLAHERYVTGGFESIHGLGQYGSLSLEGALSRAEYDNGQTLGGGKFSATYGKSLGNGTVFQIVTSEYTSENYVDFSTFYPEEGDLGILGKQKRQFGVSVSQRLSDELGVSLSAWERSYWGEADKSINLSNSWYAKFGLVSASLNFNYSKFTEEDNYSTSFSLSIPTSIFDKNVSTFANVNILNNGSTSYNAGVSTSVTDDLSVSSSVGYESKSRERSYSIDGSYEGKNIQLNAGLSQYGDNRVISGSISGGMMYLPEAGDFILGRDLRSTITVANIENLEGVGFYSSNYKTDENGNLVLPASSYLNNSVIVDPSTLPIDVEIRDTHMQVTPTEGSVTYLKFDALKVHRYLFQVRNKNGETIKSGAWATSQEGKPLGFVAPNGILFLSSLEPLNGMIIGDCSISGVSIKNVTELQEVFCD